MRGLRLALSGLAGFLVATFGAPVAQATPQFSNFSQPGYDGLGCSARSQSDWHAEIERYGDSRRDSSILTGLGRALVCVGDYPAAIKALSDAVDADPTNEIAVEWRGLCYLFAGSWDNAIADFDRALALQSSGRGIVVLHIDRAIAQRAKGDLAAALADYTQALAMDPDNAAAFNDRGVLYKKVHDPAHALADFNKAIDLNWREIAPFINRGAIYIAMGDLDHALADYEQAISLDASSPDGFSGRCAVRVLKGADLDKALADCNTALTLSPHDSSALSNRAIVYIRVSRYSDAIADAEGALRVEPDNVWALVAHGIALIRTGRADAGQRDLDAARKIDAAEVDSLSSHGIRA